MNILIFIIVLIIAVAILGFLANLITSKLELPSIVNTIIYIVCLVVAILIALSVA